MYLRNSNPATRCLLVLASGVCAAALMLMMWQSLCSCALEQERSGKSEAEKLKNPLPGDAESIEAGKKLYQRFCASCHGPRGKGDGSLALSGGTPSDLTDETWDYGSADGEIFLVIRDGLSSDMLAYKDKLSEKQIWQVISFIRSLGPEPKESKR